MQSRIKYFLAASKSLNFTVAAQQMFISQQAMTRQISLLEEELGVKLFVRTTRSVTLTEAGKVCRDEFEKLDTEMDKAIQRIQNAALANTSVVTIGFYYFFSREKIITPIMKSLYNKFPNVEFKIVLYNFQIMRYSLLDGKCDVCIAISSDWKRWAHIHAGVLKTLPFKLFVAHDHPLANHDRLPIEQMSEYDWISSGNIDTLRPTPPGWYSQIPCRAKVEVGDIFTILAYIESGMGFSCQPPVFLGTDSQTLKSFDIPYPDATLDLIYAHSDSMMNPTVLSVSKFLQQSYSVGRFPKFC